MNCFVLRGGGPKVVSGRNNGVGDPADVRLWLNFARHRLGRSGIYPRLQLSQSFTFPTNPSPTLLPSLSSLSSHNNTPVPIPLVTSQRWQTLHRRRRLDPLKTRERSNSNPPTRSTLSSQTRRRESTRTSKRTRERRLNVSPFIHHIYIFYRPIPSHHPILLF